MATHSSVLAWRIPWTGEPGGLQSIGSRRVGCDSGDLACTHSLHALDFTFCAVWGLGEELWLLT